MVCIFEGNGKVREDINSEALTQIGDRNSRRGKLQFNVSVAERGDLNSFTLHGKNIAIKCALIP